MAPDRGEDLAPESGPDDDGWYRFRTKRGVVIKIRECPGGRMEVQIPPGEYDVKDVYDIESTGEIVVDFEPKKKKDDDVRT
jgi:hypothetical protein